MKAEDIVNLRGRKIKLVLDNDYVLRGILEQINEDSIYFKTPVADSVINLDAIKEIVLIRGGS